MSSPLVGLVLNSEALPDRPSPPMNSLPPRLCPPTGLEGVAGVTGVVGSAIGDSCGEVAVADGADVPAGLKLKSGREACRQSKGHGALDADPGTYQRLTQGRHQRLMHRRVLVLVHRRRLDLRPVLAFPATPSLS